VGILPSHLVWKTRMVGLPDGEKFEDVYNPLDRIPACDRRIERQTDILPRHSPRYAYTSRGNQMIAFAVILLEDTDTNTQTEPKTSSFPNSLAVNYSQSYVSSTCCQLDLKYN